MEKNYHLFRPHPWHGISSGRNPPFLVNAYIEITPSDGIKYEIDKETGYLKVDRPQLTSSLPPALYGFIPKTYCGKKVGGILGKGKKGDGDPLDICVLSERPIQRSEVLVPSRVIGGLRMVDKGEADDKIIAVVESDPYWADTKEVADLSQVILKRLVHYFMTYKFQPEKTTQKNVVKIDRVYGRSHAKRVIEASLEDYRDSWIK